MPHNVADLVRAAAAGNPARRAFVEVGPDGAQRGELTWAELDQAVDRVVHGLRGRGLALGARVVLRMANTMTFPIAYFALLRAGLVAVPCNPAYTAREIAHLVNDSGATLLLTTPDLAPPAGLDQQPITVEVLTELPWGGADAPDAVDAVGGDEDLAVLIYTSGTTGVPKGAMLPHRALLANLEQCSALHPAPVSASDVVLLVLPLFHIYGLNAALGMIAKAAATGVLVERFDVSITLSTMAEHRVTNLPGAPPMYLAWLQAADREQLAGALSGLRLATSGAAPLPVQALESMRSEFGVCVYEGYGLTETSPVLTSNLTTGRLTPGSIGQAIPGVELTLLDEGGLPADAGDPDDPFDDPDAETTGEILVRGDNIFLGYWPDASGGPDADGWFATGDVAYRDAQGDLHLIDRRRDLILVSGFNVYPREVEVVLAAHPQIDEVAVLGIPDARTGQAVRAIVVPAAGAQLTERDVNEFAATRLARFKCPTSVQFADELPHSVTGKVSKARLRELGFADIGSRRSE